MRRRVLAGLLVLAAAPACSENSSTVVSTSIGAASAASTTVLTTTASTSTAGAGAAESTTTIALDFGELGSDTFCQVATKLVGATSVLVGTASADQVKEGFKTLRDSLSTLAEKGAVAQRPQLASAVVVLDKATARLVENGYDVAKTQAELATLDPEGATIAAITLVVTQRQAACPG